jgi:hypothetical protein
MSKPTIYRNGSKLILEGPFVDYKANLPGVVVHGNTIRKEFPVERFLLNQGEIDAAVARHREGTDVIVLGFSGYSMLDAERCAQLNIRLGEYEAASVGMVAACVDGVRSKLGDPPIRFVYGSSDLGIDRSIEEVCTSEGCDLLGFSCPNYLWWVDNSEEGPTICIMPDESQYADAYVRALDILFAMNGGKVSYEMDILAATRYHKRVAVVDVLRTLGARSQGFDHKGNVLDAAAALAERLRLITPGDEFVQKGDGDTFAETQRKLVTSVVGLARGIVSPDTAYRYMA